MHCRFRFAYAITALTRKKLVDSNYTTVESYSNFTRPKFKRLFRSTKFTNLCTQKKYKNSIQNYRNRMHHVKWAVRKRSCRTPQPPHIINSSRKAFFFLLTTILMSEKYTNQNVSAQISPLKSHKIARLSPERRTI